MLGHAAMRPFTVLHFAMCCSTLLKESQCACTELLQTLKAVELLTLCNETPSAYCMHLCHRSTLSRLLVKRAAALPEQCCEA